MNLVFRNWWMIGLLMLLVTACRDQGDHGQLETSVLEPTTVVEVTTIEATTQPTESDLGLGEVIGQRYYNNYFELEFETPDTWFVLSEDEMMTLMTKGQQVLKGQNEEIAKDLAEVDVLNLFGVFKYPMNEQVTLNPSLIITAEKLDASSGVVDGKTYLEASKSILEQTGLPYEIGLPTAVVSSDLRAHGALDAAIKFEDLEIKQRYIAFVSGDYLLSCVMTYEAGDGESGEVLRVMMNDVLGK